MSERRSEKYIPTPWHVPVAVEEVAESGQQFHLVADKDVRVATARLAALRDLPRFEANFEVTRRSAGGLRVAGRISATVGQNCVVTLEPLTNEVEEEFDLLFAPQRPVERKAGEAEEFEQLSEEIQSERALDQPDPLIGGTVDLGALAIEFLILGLDPYPRKSGAIFDPPQEVKPDEGPFAALTRLTKGQDGH